MKIDKLIAEASELPWEVIREAPWSVQGPDYMQMDVSSMPNAALIAHMSKVAPLYRELVEATHALLDVAGNLPATVCNKAAHVLLSIEELEEDAQ